MKTLPHLLLLLLLLPQIRGFKTIDVKTIRKAGEWPSSKSTLVAANQGVHNPEVKQILKQLLRRILQHRFTNQSGKALTVTVNKEDFWKLFSEKDKQRENTKLQSGASKPYMERIM
jgi:hypothetical protein